MLKQNIDAALYFGRTRTWTSVKKSVFLFFFSDQAINLWAFVKDFKLPCFLHLLIVWSPKFWSLYHHVFKAITEPAEKTLNQCSYTLLLNCVGKACICTNADLFNIKPKASSKQLGFYFPQFEYIGKFILLFNISICREDRITDPICKNLFFWFYSVWQRICLQHSPQLWERREEDRLYPIQLHEDYHVQSTKSRGLSWWVL